MDSRRRLTLGILGLALLARIAVFAVSGGVFLEGEGRVQANLATSILQGDGFQMSHSMLYPRYEQELSHPGRMSYYRFYEEVNGFYGVLRPGTPTMFLVPGYAIFQAFVFAMAGVGNFAAVGVFQLIMGLGTVMLGLILARRFLEGPWLLIAAVAMALDPFELFFEAVPATQALFSLLFMGGIVMSVTTLDSSGRRRIWLCAVTGLVWALAFFVRPAALPFVPWLAVMILISGKFRPKAVLSALALAAVFFAALVPWGLRNRAISGSFRILPTQGGVNLWESHGRIFSSHFTHEQAGALLLYTDLIEEYSGRLRSPELAEFPPFRDEPEWVRDSVLTDRMISFLGANPTLVPRLVSIRFTEFFKPFPLNSYSMIFTLGGLLFFFWVLVFMVPGSLRLLSLGGAPGVFVACGVWGYVLMHLMTIGGIPHRVAIDFPLIVVASAGLRTTYCRWRAGRKPRGV
jgi:hypothetical protein